MNKSNAKAIHICNYSRFNKFLREKMPLIPGNKSNNNTNNHEKFDTIPKSV